MTLTIVAVWNWKNRSLVSFESVPDFGAGIERSEVLKKKYYSKTSEKRVKSELELWAEDVSQSDDSSYDVSVVSFQGNMSLESVKKRFIAQKKGD